jgi:hypothetical protein
MSIKPVFCGFLIITLLAETGPTRADTRIDNPKIGGLPVDHCASVNGPPSQANDCSANGNALAVDFIFKQYNYTANVGFGSWIQISGQAVHLQITFQNGTYTSPQWPTFPTGGIFDAIVCR